MNYKVLYRKYRPTSFENVIGQDYIIKTLKNSIKSGNISHAYIFSGPRGTGKTSTAKIFAKAINCLSPVNGEPCGNCEFCKNYAEHPDIVEMDAASNNGVDEIREIIDNIKLSPTSAKYKVYIIDEVHMLTTSAFNALLLTLEEPPSHVVFIFATTNIESVPITILSRCQRFDFQKIDVASMKSRIANICSLEKIAIDDDAIEEIAYLAEGGMRDALSLLDQLSKSNEKITVDLIEKVIRIFSNKSIDLIIKSLENNDLEKFLNQMSDCRKQNVDYKSFLKRMIDALSLRAKKVKQNGKQSNLSYKQYKELILELSGCFSKININVDPFMIIEVIMLDYFNQAVVLKSFNTDTPQEKNVESLMDETIKIRVNNCLVNAKKQDLEDVKIRVDNIVDSLSNGIAKSILTDSLPVAASKDYIIFSTENETSMKKANTNVKKIEKIINADKNNYKIVFVSKSYWEKVKGEYISNMKKGIKYMHINETENDTVLNDIFDSSKIEIV